MSVLSERPLEEDQQPLADNAGIALDDANGRVLVADPSSRRILSIDTNTGEWDVFSESGGSGRRIVIDRANERALAMNSGQVWQFNLETGERASFSNASTPNDENRLRNAVDLAMDPGGERAIVLGGSTRDEQTLYAIDLASGARQILSSAESPSGWQFEFAGVDIDASTRRIVAVESDSRSSTNIFEVAPDGDQRRLISGVNTPNSADAIRTPSSIALDNERQRAWVTTGRSGRIYLVDLVTGERVLMWGL
ncbi:MAG: hypothetical protein AAFQ65_00930 [Myxococcota bacterium]